MKKNFGVGEVGKDFLDTLNPIYIDGGEFRNLNTLSRRIKPFGEVFEEAKRLRNNADEITQDLANKIFGSTREAQARVGEATLNAASANKALTEAEIKLGAAKHEAREKLTNLPNQK